MKSPAHFHIKALLLDPAGYSRDDVLQMCRRDELDVHSEDQLIEVQAELNPPDNFAPCDPRHQPSARYLARERCVGYFRPDEHYLAACDILHNASAREICETLLLSHAPPEEVASMVARRTPLRPARQAVLLFSHYFWNLQCVDSSQVRAILLNRQERLAGQLYPTAAEGLNAMRRVSAMDPRTVAANLPWSPQAARLAMLGAGMPMGRIDQLPTLEDIQGGALLRTLEAVQQGGRGGAEAAVAFMTVAKMSSEMLAGIARPESMVVESLRKLRLRSNPATPSLLSELGGTHTEGLLPTLDAPGEAVE